LALPYQPGEWTALEIVRQRDAEKLEHSSVVSGDEDACRHAST
jgi:hypothetical protein